jgi:hypothetical protein
MVYSEPPKGGRGKNSSLKLEFSGQRLSFARIVLRYSTPLAREVMSGKTALNDAVEVVRQYEHHAATTPLRICRKGSGSRWPRVPGWAA